MYEEQGARPPGEGREPAAATQPRGEPEQPAEPPRSSRRRLALPTLGMLSDRLGVSAAAIVIGVAAIAAAAFGGWWALRTPPGPTAEEILPAAADMPIPTPAPVPEVEPPIVVHVAGAVIRPGVHELAPGSRVIDAIDAAGGLAEEADGTRLNLAQPLDDGVRVWVPSLGEEVTPAVVSVESPMSPDADAGTGGDPPIININTADAAALQSLSGIGPSLAAAIVEHRERNGPFASVDDLVNVAGIGPAKLEQLRPQVTL